MKMNKLKTKTGYYSLAVFVLLIGIAEWIQAAVITNNFSGTITYVVGTPFGISASIGDPVSGSFTYDTSLPPAYNSGVVAGYNQPPPSGMSVVISGLTLQSQNNSSLQVTNNYFGSDGFSGFFTPISAGGVLQLGSSMLFYLSDSTQTVLSNTALPTSLDLLSFSFRTGSISDVASNGIVYFSINPPPIPVKIDIKPDDFPNSINPKNNGRIPVAILTTGPSDNFATFDAANDVDVTTVHFGSKGTEAVPVHNTLEDVDKDGDLDMLFFFNIQDTNIDCLGTSATLTGETIDGKKIAGTDSIQTVGCK